MARFETWFRADLTQPQQVHAVRGNVFTQDNMANRVGVQVYDDAEPVTLEGSVMAYVIRADDATVACPGEKDGNAAWVDLPESAYAVPGLIQIAIRLTNGDNKTVLTACTGYVTKSTTDTIIDPGEVIPDISELLACIDDCEAATAAATAAAADAENVNISQSKSGDEITITTTDRDGVETSNTIRGGGSSITDTASGAIASFPDGADNEPMESVKVGIEPVQDLHGYANPWPAGGGKNKCSVDSLSAGGSDPRTTRIEIAEIPAGSYYVSLTKGGTASSNIGIQFLNASAQKIEQLSTAQVLAGGAAITLSESAVYLYIFMGQTEFNNGQTFTLSNIQVESGSTATSYAPYSNVCPITGWTGANVYNDPVYGGSIGWNQLVAIPASSKSATVNGVTVTDNRDGSYTLNDTATNANANVWIYGAYNTTTTYYTLLKDHKYLTIGIRLYQVKNGTVPSSSSSSNTNLEGSRIVWPTAEGWCGGAIRMGDYTANKTYNNLKIRPMMFDLTQMFGAEIADQITAMDVASPGAGLEYFKSLFPKDYYAYNTGTVTTVSAVNGNPYRYYPITWTEAGTVYGGVVDVVSGQMTVDKAMGTGFTRGQKDSTQNLYLLVNSSVSNRKVWNDTTNSPPIISNVLPSLGLTVARNTHEKCVSQYSDGFWIGGYIGEETALDTLLQTLTIVYPLATPITYTLTPTQITSLLGQNNVWADTGNTEATYKADTKLYIDKKLAALAAQIVNA